MAGGQLIIVKRCLVIVDCVYSIYSLELGNEASLELGNEASLELGLQ